MIVTFSHIHLFLPHGWVRPLVGITDYVVSTFMSYHKIIIVFIQAQLRRFTVTVVGCSILNFFMWFFHTYEYNHSLVLLITLELLCWATILYLYIIIVFLAAQWRCFTVTIVDFYIFSKLFFPSPLMSATNRWIDYYIGSTLLSDHIISILIYIIISLIGFIVWYHIY